MCARYASAACRARSTARPTTTLHNRLVVSCRDEILEVARILSQRQPDQTFRVDDVVTAMVDRGTKFLESTIQYHVMVVMCVNAKGRDAGKYPDLEHVARRRYRLVQK
ncbi:hypothetical protein SAMN00790413_05233 [Deinococcus hopiensis KR-140]|uniref:DUF7669 domain-containing protein n=2 Tax=Deinococcus TaxID=1298 RepID=A0A1W1UUE5_9DEIO|nr:hypothetical protein SAMN00790413_05233 [Deinococcus hopiensis KR-140]